MKRLIAPALAACLSLAATGCIIVTDDATLTIVNDSDYVIEEVYLTDVGSRSWGRNLLGGDVLFPGESFTLGVACDYYDALVVDEDGVQCEVYDLDLCLNDATWYFRNNTCSVFSAKGETETPSLPGPATTAVSAPQATH